MKAVRHTPALAVSAGLVGLTSIMARAANLLLVAVIAHSSAGVSGVGLYGLATLAGSLAAQVASFGLPTYVSRSFHAGSMSRSTVSTLHWIRLAFIFGAAASAIGGARFFVPAGVGITPFALLMLATMFDQWNESAWPVVRATRGAWREPAVNAATGLVCVIVCALQVYHLDATLTQIAATVLATSICRAALVVLTTRMVLRASSVRDMWAIFTEIVRAAWPYMTADLLGLAYLRGDTIVLALLVSPEDLGYYVAATTIVYPLVQVGAGMSMGAVAHGSRLLGIGNTPTDHAPHERKVLPLFECVGHGAAVGTLLGAQFLIPVLFGHDSSISTQRLVNILVLFVSLRFLNFGLSTVLVMHDEGRRRLTALALSVVANIGLNLLLVPAAGSDGAAWAAVLTEVVLGMSLLRAVPDLRRAVVASLTTVAFAASSIAVVTFGAVAAAELPIAAIAALLVRLGYVAASSMGVLRCDI
jgi:O-antigen/teichoic acid export membrane protein